MNFLAQRHGFEATVQLLRDNRNGSVDRFNALVQSLTGMDVEALDGSVGTWVATGAMPAAGQLVAQAATATTQPVTTAAATATAAAVPATTTAQPVAVAGTPTPGRMPATRPWAATVGSL